MTWHWKKSLAAVLAGGVLGTAQAGDTPPDFSGVWTFYNPGGGGFRRGAGAPEPLPFTEIAQRKVAEYQALVAPGGDTPGGFCVGTGMPGSMLGSGGYPMEIIQRPEQITVIYEAHTEIRRIYMNGRVVPDEDLFPTRNGYSAGRWEGDTLVVDTKALAEQVDQQYAHSSNARVVERYRLSKDEAGKDILTAEMTLTDPEFYTKPVTATKRWTRAEADARMLPYECNEPTWLNHLQSLAKRTAGKR